MWLWFRWEGQKSNSSENIWKELDLNEICRMEWAETAGKRNLVRDICEGESAAELFLAPEAMQVVGQGLLY